MSTATASQYTAESITVLEGLEAVRRRPGMYVGGTDIKALHHLVYEVVDNSIDEALAGFCDHVKVTINVDSSITVEDNGRGIPVEAHREKKISSLQLVMTVLHAGGKFDRDSYKVSGGLHGVGVSAVNALSDWLVAEIKRDGGIWQQRYERGIPVTAVVKVADVPEEDTTTGTKMTFHYDDTIFKEVEEGYKWHTLLTRFREMAFVTKGIRITLADEREELRREHTFYFEGGITSFVRYLNRNRETLHVPIYAEKTIDNIGVEVAIQYTDAYTESVYAFANTIHTPDGGTHMTGLRGALTRTINDYARKNGMLKDNDTNFSGDDTREGLTAIVSVKHPDPQFESQTKVKLMNTEVRNIVETVVAEAMTTYLEENPKYARLVIEKCLTSSRARMAAKKARELVLRKSALESTTLPGKLADCSNRDSENSEMYIVEGDSAGGCFSGETQVALADGRALSFHELIAEQAQGKQNFCYTIRRDGTIGLEQITNVRRTKSNATVIKITLDNGETITCTPDHRFMLRDGSYKAAELLTPDESLMPLYRKLSDMSEPNITISGYEMAWDPRSDSWLFTHVLADWYNNDDKLLAQAKLQWSHYNYENNSTYRQRYFAGDSQQVTEAVLNYNHRIVKIEHVAESMDVYDLEVPYTHNFALASGVFVHNSAKMGRDRKFQAILPLRGKILNTERARLDKILGNNEVKALITALGTGIGDDFTLTRLRYGRIIIMTDADVDGAHIRTLLLTFFFRYMPTLIEGGHLYIAQPPLYQLKYKKEVIYVYSDDEKEGQLKKFDRNSAQVHIQRYKGLGEMNPEQLWDTTMNPDTRILLQVTVDDATEADKTFDMLMGSAVPPRRKFIQTHAKQVQNLDV